MGGRYKNVVTASLAADVVRCWRKGCDFNSRSRNFVIVASIVDEKRRIESRNEKSAMRESVLRYRFEDVIAHFSHKLAATRPNSRSFSFADRFDREILMDRSSLGRDSSERCGDRDSVL